MDNVLSVFFISVVFVGSLYVWALVDGKKYLTANRNHPSIIKRRAISATLATLTLLVYFSWSIDVSTITAALGFSLTGPVSEDASLLTHVAFSALSGIVLTLFLFLGPLVMEIIDVLEEAAVDQKTQHGPYHNTSIPVILFEKFVDFCGSCPTDALFLRAQVVAPIAEEICYRLLPILLLSSTWSCSRLIWVTPLFFGMAHLHHVFSMILFEGVPWHSALLSSLFQFFYTTVFGWFAAALFVNTGNVIGPIISHSICNAFGFPRINEINEYKRANLLWIIFVIGVLLFFFGLLEFPWAQHFPVVPCS